MVAAYPKEMHLHTDNGRTNAVQKIEIDESKVEVKYATAILPDETSKRCEWKVAYCEIDGKVFYNVENYLIRNIPRQEETAAGMGTFGIHCKELDITDCFIAEPRAHGDAGGINRRSEYSEGLYIHGPNIDSALEAVKQQLKLEQIYRQHLYETRKGSLDCPTDPVGKGRSGKKVFNAGHGFSAANLPSLVENIKDRDGKTRLDCFLCDGNGINE